LESLEIMKLKLNKKYIENLVLQEIKCFRDNKGEQVASDYWLCNQIGYIGALLFILDRHRLIALFDEVHNKIRDK
jgi:hypothetical protein